MSFALSIQRQTAEMRRCAQHDRECAVHAKRSEWAQHDRLGVGRDCGEMLLPQGGISMTGNAQFTRSEANGLSMTANSAAAGSRAGKLSSEIGAPGWRGLYTAWGSFHTPPCRRTVRGIRSKHGPVCNFPYWLSHHPAQGNSGCGRTNRCRCRSGGPWGQVQLR